MPGLILSEDRCTSAGASPLRTAKAEIAAAVATTSPPIIIDGAAGKRLPAWSRAKFTPRVSTPNIAALATLVGSPTRAFTLQNAAAPPPTSRATVHATRDHGTGTTSSGRGVRAQKRIAAS